MTLRLFTAVHPLESDRCNFVAYISARAVWALVLLSRNFVVIRDGRWNLGGLMPSWLGSPAEKRCRSFGLRNRCTYVALFHLQPSAPHFFVKVWPNSSIQFQSFAAKSLIALAHFGKPVRMTLPLRIASR